MGTLGLVIALLNNAAAQESPTGVTGASLIVRVAGARPDSPVTVFIESSRRGASDVLAPGTKAVLTKEALPFDRYYVSATQGDDLVTRIEAVLLDPGHPSASVPLELSQNHSTLVLASHDWNPVRKATVKPMRPAGPPFLRASPDVVEVEPGVFRLDALRPGTPLLIHADGFVPVCRVVPRNETDFAWLEPGRQIDVQFPRDITPAAVEIATLDDLPSSNCPVPLAAFKPAVVRAGIDGQPYRIDHFPSARRLLLQRPGFTRQIVVPDRGAVVVEGDTHSESLR